MISAVTGGVVSGEEQWRRWARDQGLEPADEAADAALRVLAAGASVVAAESAAETKFRYARLASLRLSVSRTSALFRSRCAE